MKLQIIEQLELRYVPTPKGTSYHLVKDGYVQLPLGVWSLLNYDIGVLEIMLEQSISQEEVERLNEDRLNRLMADKQPAKALQSFDDFTKFYFAPAQNYKEQEMIDYLTGLSPQKRTQKLGEFAVWFNNQERELARVAG